MKHAIPLLTPERKHVRTVGSGFFIVKAQRWITDHAAEKLRLGFKTRPVGAIKLGVRKGRTDSSGVIPHAKTFGQQVNEIQLQS